MQTPVLVRHHPAMSPATAASRETGGYASGPDSIPREQGACAWIFGQRALHATGRGLTNNVGGYSSVRSRYPIRSRVETKEASPSLKVVVITSPLHS